MIHNLRTMSAEALEYTRKDLDAVIGVQEETVRHGGRCDKLGTYYDDRFAVLDEMRHRAARTTTRHRAA
jgi:hypothetical protein